MEKPDCFTDQEWDLYKEMTFIVVTNASERSKVNYCRECTPDRQAKMIAQNKCRWPTVQFFLARSVRETLDEQEIIGFRPRTPRHNYVILKEIR